jgi:protein-L-isoaspartate(D-aspartate) O-methyltransferase
VRSQLPAAWCCALIVMGGCAAVACNGGATLPEWKAERLAMVERQIEARGVRDAAVLEAMRTVPRHLFIPEELRAMAYADSPQPIGDGQTISQPYIVALMTELLQVEPGDRVLEIGTGSGYQSAVLAQMGVEVYSIEIKTSLCEQARRTLEATGYDTVEVRCGDGYGGWPEAAPFDGVIVTAAPERIPGPLLDQLVEGGRMVIPVGPFYQDLKVLQRTADGIEESSVIPVRFVPMTGEIERVE